LDEDVDDAATGQAHAERGVIADPVALEHRLAAGHDLASQIVDRALDATTRDTAHHLPRWRDGHRGTPCPWPATQRLNEGRQAERFPLFRFLPPFHDLV